MLPPLFYHRTLVMTRRPKTSWDKEGTTVGSGYVGYCLVKSGFE
jgi:hypothetical protein